MKQKIRKSTLRDAQDFVRIKAKLPIPKNKESAKKGGFLLGTDINTYRFYIKNGNCLTALFNNEMVGFGIILPNQLVRNSDLWEKRKQVNWSINFEDIENSNVSYVEQLAFLKGHRKLSLILSYNLVKSVFDNGSDYILTTTVKEPIMNIAAIPYIKAIGGYRIGNIDEVYLSVGRINSDVYLIEKGIFYKKIRKLSFFDFLKSNEL